VETRLERGGAQTGLGGLFKQYELIYVLGDERDLLHLRTNFRGEKVYLYPTIITPEQARIVFLDVIKKVNKLNDKPEFYNVITGNCTTSLVPHLAKVLPTQATCLQLLLNGDADAAAHRNGRIKSNVPFDEAKRLHHINQYVKDDPEAADFSKRIRPDLTR
jgi:hypothetical protein